MTFKHTLKINEFTFGFRYGGNACFYVFKKERQYATSEGQHS